MDDAHKELVKRLDAGRTLLLRAEQFNEKLAAERDRLKAALQVIASDPTHSGQAMIARKALGGDA